MAAVYPEPLTGNPSLPRRHKIVFDAGIPVPEIYEVDGDRGIILQEDLGDRQLFHFYENATDEECEEFREQAIN